TTTSAGTTVTVNPLPTPALSKSADTLSTQSSFLTYQWFMNNSALPGAVGSRLLLKQPGIYYVVVTDGHQCQGQSRMDTVSTVGVAHVAGNWNDVQIYPNPASSIVHIDAPYDVNVSVSTVDGRELLNRENAKTIDISGLADGVYMIRVSNRNGATISIE